MSGVDDWVLLITHVLFWVLSKSGAIMLFPVGISGYMLFGSDFGALVFSGDG
jgi:hypothetical protein